MLTFISGGARSGKSEIAEQMAVRSYQQNQWIYEKSALYYLATSQVLDREMESRIMLHKDRRDSIWRTIEEPVEVDNVLRKVEKEDVVLLDCLTIWLNNMIYLHSATEEELASKIDEWSQIQKEKGFHLIVVSNDLNEDIPTQNDEVERYRRLLGKIHQFIVTHSDQAIQVVAGIPVTWKGAPVI